MTVKSLTIKQVLLRIVIIIASVEALIMVCFAVIPNKLNVYSLTSIDVTALAFISTPLIYFWIIRPFVVARDNAITQLENMANTDPLTKLANRRLFLRHLERDIAGNIRHKHYGGLLLIDLDGFKLINDHSGHDAGDAVLVEVAKRFQSLTRSEDIVARLGGDEFILLLNRLDEDERIAKEKVFHVAEKLIATVNKPVKFNGEMLQVSASIGIRLLGFETLNGESAIREADIAMYEAKERGKGCAVFYDK
ncbi:GGDEF domain-containing protein [Kangiella koreensis]|uniref:Diguanylate cyclase n=1 Tax=Kangiella koreensis (strain DSM 16069 / JCM 12317 / KCTC 12182 / SW-125) TaxID=523791 RepID=C7R673_KANKD|nr:GGDEF domain-containing protein [Kangiella koreensis]ACV25504.1 diguanylate cyclase [Kangiella koreensis DSM 16069]